jgi:chromate transporter
VKAACVLWAFLLQGLSCFGGPVAHLARFRQEFVVKRGWLTTDEYESLLALTQFLPGPASSQTGFCIGLHRAGFLGGVAAWTGFTLPSAALMALIATYAATLQANPVAQGVLHGLQLAAVAVVAQAVWQMAGSLCPDTPRRATALLATAVLAMIPGTPGQLMVLGVGGLAGWATLDESNLARPREHASLAAEVAIARRELHEHLFAVLALLLFAGLLIAAFMAPTTGPVALAAAFYRAGALVFGGGHVVLPLLRDAVVLPGWVSPHLFLSGYGAAQAMPGPLFTVASYLGALVGGYTGAVIATVAIFLPGLLLVMGVLPYWQSLRGYPAVGAIVKGLNAAVVGLLGWAFINLLTLTAIQSLWDIPIIAGALVLLVFGGARPILVVLFCAAAAAVF